MMLLLCNQLFAIVQYFIIPLHLKQVVVLGVISF